MGERGKSKKKDGDEAMWQSDCGDKEIVAPVQEHSENPIRTRNNPTQEFVCGQYSTFTTTTTTTISQPHVRNISLLKMD